MKSKGSVRERMEKARKLLDSVYEDLANNNIHGFKADDFKTIQVRFLCMNTDVLLIQNHVVLGLPLGR